MLGMSRYPVDCTSQWDNKQSAAIKLGKTSRPDTNEMVPTITAGAVIQYLAQAYQSLDLRNQFSFCRKYLSAPYTESRGNAGKRQREEASGDSQLSTPKRQKAGDQSHAHTEVKDYIGELPAAHPSAWENVDSMKLTLVFDQDVVGQDVSKWAMFRTRMVEQGLSRENKTIRPLVPPPLTRGGSNDAVKVCRNSNKNSEPIMAGPSRRTTDGWTNYKSPSLGHQSTNLQKKYAADKTIVEMKEAGKPWIDLTGLKADSVGHHRSYVQSANQSTSNFSDFSPTGHARDDGVIELTKARDSND
ncbi:MAG: hypothetical protein Q9171_003013 [Xanthocarpia ochracea]